MINWAIFWKTARDSASLILAASLGIVAFVVLFVWAMLDMGEQLMAFLSQFAFLRQIFEFGFGIDIKQHIESVKVQFYTKLHIISLNIRNIKTIPMLCLLH